MDIWEDTWTNERSEMKRMMRHVEIMMKGVAVTEMWKRGRGVDLKNQGGKNVRLNEKRER